MSRRTNVENFVSIRQAVAEKNTKVVCGQNKQTDPNAIPSPLARVKNSEVTDLSVMPDQHAWCFGIVAADKYVERFRCHGFWGIEV